jgi:hypothetical protein
MAAAQRQETDLELDIPERVNKFPKSLSCYFWWDTE